MKKFSWIFALILALSIGFIGCPSGGDDDGDDTPVTPVTPGEPPFIPNPDVTAISISFGEGDGDTEALCDKADGTKVGAITYYDPNNPDPDVPAGGYKYTYGSGANTNYGNAIVRFVVDLGDARLGDFGGIEFKWKGISGDVGLSNGSPDHPDYSKNLYILASGSEGDLKPTKSDTQNKANIINTVYFVANSGDELYVGAAGVPMVKGLAGYPDPKPDVTEPYTIATPIVLKKTLTGEVYLAFYFHATGGSYAISDVKLVPVADFEKKDPPAPPPPLAPVEPPEGMPEDAIVLPLALTVANCSDASTASGIESTGIIPTIVDGKLRAAFTLANQRLNIGLNAEQVAAIMYGSLKTGDTGRVYVVIEAEVSDGTGDSFRYHIGNIKNGGGWNATQGSNNQFNPAGFKTLDEIKILSLGFDNPGGKHGNDGTDPVSNYPYYFILQHGGDTAVTIDITSITLGVMPSDVSYDDAVGLEYGLSVANAGTFVDGEFHLGKGGVGDSSGIYIDLAALTDDEDDDYVEQPVAAGATSTGGTKMLVVSYICQETELYAKLTVKNNGDWSGTDVDYPALITDGVGTIKVAEASFTNGLTKIFFQTNDYQNEDADFNVKILGVVLK